MGPSKGSLNLMALSNVHFSGLTYLINKTELIFLLSHWFLSICRLGEGLDHPPGIPSETTASPSGNLHTLLAPGHCHLNPSQLCPCLCPLACSGSHPHHLLPGSARGLALPAILMASETLIMSYPVVYLAKSVFPEPNSLCPLSHFS